MDENTESHAQLSSNSRITDFKKALNIEVPRCNVVVMDENAESHAQLSSNCPITDFEKALNIEVPHHLKNIFIFCGYQNKFTISEITETDIEDMEKICREQLPKVISCENELKSYLGNIFYKSPSNFFITPGNKKIIRKLIEFCKNKPTAKRPSCDKPDSSATKKKKEYPENFERRKQLYNTNMEDDNLEMEKSKVLNLITNWIKNICVKHLEREQLPRIFQEMNKLQIHLSESSSSNCSVTCSICLKDQKLFRNTSGCWITSNFQKHFKTHLPNFLKRNNKNMTVSEFFKIKNIENENLDSSNSMDPQPGCSSVQKSAKQTFSIVSVESVADESLDNVLDNLDTITEIKKIDDLLNFSENKIYFRESKIKEEIYEK